jgi:hypothetical protein
MTDAEVDLTNEDMTTIIEALQIALERTGHMVLFLETHPPNKEDESGYKERYEQGISDGNIFIRRGKAVLLKFAIAGAEAATSAHQ